MAFETREYDPADSLTTIEVAFVHALSISAGNSAPNVTLNTTLTTKGDLFVRNATSIVRQGVGADGFILTADSSQATGIKWAAATGGGGITNSAGANVITKSNGTNLVASQITDDGTTVMIAQAGNLKSIQIGGGSGTGIQLGGQSDDSGIVLASDTVSLGDIGGTVNNTLISINDSDPSISLRSNGGITQIGDLGGAFNGTTLILDDTLTSVTISKNLIVGNLATGGSAPATTGTRRMVISDANGLLSFTTIPTGTVTSVTGTTNRITVATGTTTPVIDISATFEALLGKVASPLSQFASTTSLQLAGVISDETGSGALVFGTAPTITLASASTGVTQTPGDNSTKIATTAYVQAAIFATQTIAAARLATTAALTATYSNGSSGVGATLTEVGLGALTVDGVTPSVGNRILVKNQASTFQNGIYTVTTVGSAGVAYVLTRASDYNVSADINLGDTIFVSAGSTLASTTWTQNGTENPVMGTDPITFAQTAGPGSYTAGNGLSLSGTQFAIDTSITVDKNTAQALTNKSVNGVTLTTGGGTTTFLNANGAYSTPGGGSGITRSVNNVSGTTSAGAASSTDYAYLCTGTFTITLPTAVGNTNLYTISNVGTAIITIATTSAQTINGLSNWILRQQYDSLSLISDGSNWMVV